MPTNSNDTLSAPPPAPSPETPPVFTEDDVLCHTRIADVTKLFDALIRLLAQRDPAIDPAVALQAIQAREAVASTFLSPGIAMPHARLDGIDRTLVAVATSVHGVPFGSDRGTARLVILVLTPSSAPTAYLSVVATLARLLRQRGFVDEVLAEKTATGVAALFRGAHRDPSLPPYVCAADMMDKPLATLRKSDSVKDAIDLVLRTGYTDIPVVDKDGELVGVASTQAILGICLPDYILWLEDLSRYTSFEPFETLLSKESSTWLADITEDACSVTQDQPAIAVAEAMARNKANICFVTDADKKLVGAITLKRFLRNVFRD
ncbi:MAG: PTS sugar transporter subunit IIA [Kiritimatiellae bacterium]|nr:PTS sugar transporter subunit IIA [Kiritimatiellia bacterium]